MGTKKVILILFLISFKLPAITYKVIGPCSGRPLAQGEWPVKDFSQSIGAISLQILDKLGLAYFGNERGLYTIAEAGPGKEQLSLHKVRFHGWAYLVNGLIPDKLSHQFFFDNDNDELIWAYSYVEYNNNGQNNDGDQRWSAYKYTYKTRPHFLWNKAEGYCLRRP